MHDRRPPAITPTYSPYIVRCRGCYRIQIPDVANNYIPSPEGIRASDPIIRGNLVVWAEGTGTLPFIDRKIIYNALMKMYDIETGSTHTLFRQSTFVAPHAIVGNALAFTQYDRVRDTTGLYLVELPASGEKQAP